MDHPRALDHQNARTLTHFITTSQFLKKTTQLLLSVSLFSLLLSHFSYLYHLDSLNLHFQSFRHKWFTYSVDKNYMFLLCNGLLVVLAKFSGLISSSSSSSSSSSLNNYDHGCTDFTEFSPGNYEDRTPIVKPGEPILLEKEISLGTTIHEEAQGKENDECIAGMEGDVHEEIKDLVTIEDEEEAKGGGGEIERVLIVVEKEVGALIEEDDDQGGGVVEEEEFVVDDKFPVLEGEEGNGVISTEELNKKFDEFIRKMKEGIRIEAQQRLVVVK